MISGYWGILATGIDGAPWTIEKYQSSLMTFVAFLDGRGMPLDPAGVTGKHVRAFIAGELANWNAATAHVRFRSIKTFFRWCFEVGEIKSDPMMRAKPQMLPDESSAVPSEFDISKLLKVCTGSDFTAQRDTAIIRTLMDTGMQVGELAGAKRSWIGTDRLSGRA